MKTLNHKMPIQSSFSNYHHLVVIERSPKFREF